MSELHKHEWFTPVKDGPQFCGACGGRADNSPPWCRGRPVTGKPATKETTSTGIHVDLSRIVPKTDEEMAEYVWEHETKPRLKAAGFQDRHRQRIDDWKCGPQQKVFEKCLELCSGVGAVVVLTGERGTGKTTICGQLARIRAQDESLAPWDRQPPYRKLVDIIARYKPLYGNMGSVDMDGLASDRDYFCRTPSLKFIDEIHECEDAALKMRVLTDVIDRCYAAKTDVILVSNQSVDGFKATAGDSVLSRLSEHGSIIPCNWKSWRAKG